MTDRIYSLPASGASLPLPTFFPSISSVKTNLRPLDYLTVLEALGYPLYLISAYDISNASGQEQAAITQLLRLAVQRNAVVLLDSGNYEKYWFKDTTWTVNRYHRTLSSTSFIFAFCYDNQEPPRTVAEIAHDVETAVLRDAQYTSSGSLIPIIHGPNELLPDAVAEVAHRLQPLFIAVPERILGDGLVARARSVFRIRKALNNLGTYYPLHLLGTGNPLSILVYAVCGADSFDGLEWCQTVIDHDSARPYHFHHWDFFSHQSNLRGLSYVASVLAHNLFFYRDWMERISNALLMGAYRKLLEGYLPLVALNKLRDELPEVFSIG